MVDEPAVRAEPAASPAPSKCYRSKRAQPTTLVSSGSTSQEVGTLRPSWEVATRATQVRRQHLTLNQAATSAAMVGALRAWRPRLGRSPTSGPMTNQGGWRSGGVVISSRLHEAISKFIASVETRPWKRTSRNHLLVRAEGFWGSGSKENFVLTVNLKAFA